MAVTTEDASLPVGYRLAAFTALVFDPSARLVAADWWAEGEADYERLAKTAESISHRFGLTEEFERLSGGDVGNEALCAFGDAVDRALPAAERRSIGGDIDRADTRLKIGLHSTRPSRPHEAQGLVELSSIVAARRPIGAETDRTAEDVDKSPIVHVIIPFRDDGGGERARNLTACLLALGDQQPSGPAYRTTVVESDGTCRWSDHFAELCDAYVFAAASGRFNKSWTVNVGFKSDALDCPITCVLDADVVVDDEFVARNVARFDDDPSLNSLLPYVRMYCLDEESSCQAIAERVVARHPDVRLADVNALVLRRPPGACMWVRSSCFEQVAGFDERYFGWGGEDDDIVERLGRVGPVQRFDDPLIHLAHPRPQMEIDGTPLNAHLRPGTWTGVNGFGRPAGPSTE